MKKIFTLFAFTAFIASSLYAQEWMKNMDQKNPNFYDIQKAFNNSYKDKKENNEVSGKEDGSYEKFKRWEWFWGQRVGKDGLFPAPDVNRKEWQKYSESKKNINPVQTMSSNWIFMGTSTSKGGYSGIGRINCIAFHPTDANTFWVGTPAGGLWKTTDGGNTWATNTDNLPVLGIGDIAIDNTNPNIMYIATGDGEAALSLSNGKGDTKSIGVLKSTDGGATWNTTGLNWNVTSQKLIRRLLINPNNTQVLLAAASDGIWRTTDGGSTWTKQQAGWFIDMELKPSDPNFVYASTFDPSGGNAQIFTSTDNGITFTPATSLSGIIRINLAVSANSPALVDALCANKQEGLAGLYRSTNSGASFTQYLTGTCSNNFLNSSYKASGCSGQGNYDLAYAINPSNSNEIWLGGTNTWRTTDGGTNWSLNNVWAAYQTTSVPEVHADKHFIAFHPLNNNVYECNDGGLYVTNDGGVTWTDKTNGLGISEIYRIGTSATIANNVICGLQDNGSKELNGGLWNDRTGGDGMECIIDYTNANIQYTTYVQGKIYKTTNAWSDYTTIVRNDTTGVDTSGAWVTPYIMNPTNNNTLLVGKSQVYKTTNGGTTWAQLGTITGITGDITSMAYAPSDTNTIYVASESAGELFKTTNGGGTWTLINTTTTKKITYISVDPLNSQRLWTTSSGYTAGDKVWYSPDGGTTWTNFSGTLPNLPANCIVYEKGSNDGLYIGTDAGIFYRNASMSDWTLFSTGLPNVVVNELEISYNNNKLWAATFGRGLWQSDLYGAFTGINNNLNSSNSITIFPNPSQGHFTIQSEIALKNGELEVLNILGEKVCKNKMFSKSTEIDLSKQPIGVYFLRVKSENGTAVQKIIIQK